MKPTSSHFKSLCSLLILMLQTVLNVDAGSQFASHVTVNTPARSFTHGVGDPLPLTGRRSWQRQQQRFPSRSLRKRPITNHGGGGGYPRMKPTIPFNAEDKPLNMFPSVTPRHHNNYMEMSIPVLPLSPYKVDSPDPESLWPEGLFLPPLGPQRFSNFNRRSDTSDASESDSQDPYLLEGSEAIAAVTRAKTHGHLYFHDIPHIQSLLANQVLRIQNQLEPHRIGSIRHTWPYNRP